MINNPLIRGFNPDPSICFDGKRFLLVTSTFEFFPSTPIYESYDLKSWRFHSFSIRDEKLLDLRGCPNSSGTYAATIRYNKGVYYVVTTNKMTGDNFIVFNDDIDKKPWQGPLFVRRGGIDPSLYFEDDFCYYCSNGVLDGKKGILGAYIDIKNGKLISPLKLLTEGITQHATEAPHIYKRNGYYYLIVAEGGTEAGHHENVFRSKCIEGPYEAYKNNPILSHIKRKGYEIQCTGHADLIDIGNDNWIAVFLAVRLYSTINRGNLGRESFIAEVKWIEDGWPVIGNGGFVDLEMESSLIDNKRETIKYFDLSLPIEKQNLEGIRRFDLSSFSQDLEKKKLLIKGKCDITEDLASPSILLSRQKEFETEVSICLKTDDSLTGRAGLAVYLTNNYSLILRIFKDDGVLKYTVERNVHDLKCIVSSGTMEDKPYAKLKISADREFYHMHLDGKEIAKASVCNFAPETTMYRCFTGTMFALFSEFGNAVFFEDN